MAVIGPPFLMCLKISSNSRMSRMATPIFSVDLLSLPMISTKAKTGLSPDGYSNPPVA